MNVILFWFRFSLCFWSKSNHKPFTDHKHNATGRTITFIHLHNCMMRIKIRIWRMTKGIKTNSCLSLMYSLNCFQTMMKISREGESKEWPLFFPFQPFSIIKWSQSRSNTDNGLFVMCSRHWQMPGTCFMIHTQQNESILCFVFVWFCPVLQKSTFRHLTETDHSFLIRTALKRGSCSGSQHSLRSFPLFLTAFSLTRTLRRKHPIARALFPSKNAWSQHP